MSKNSPRTTSSSSPQAKRLCYTLPKFQSRLHWNFDSAIIFRGAFSGVIFSKRGIFQGSFPEGGDFFVFWGGIRSGGDFPPAGKKCWHMNLTTLVIFVQGKLLTFTLHTTAYFILDEITVVAHLCLEFVFVC